MNWLTLFKEAFKTLPGATPEETLRISIARMAVLLSLAMVVVLVLLATVVFS